MAVLLGIDTGGTFTDAVLYDDGGAGRVIAKAKALTTRDDLAVGIAGAIRAVMTEATQEPGSVALVSISTTLATNALVEGLWRPVCLIFLGFDEADVARGGLAQALAGDPVIVAPGGFRATGEPRAPLDLAALEARIAEVENRVEGFAVVSMFGGRNPAHEIAVRELIARRSGLPVTCGHELSAELDGPRNALTSVLNARLIGVISALIASTRSSLDSFGIDAPLMIVRGDGSLVSADFARRRPIETILSGPAASLVGAGQLTGLKHALVSDIGGTTTDIAVLRDGRPELSATGAQVGAHRTMIEAVAMTTHGLGGDSEVRLEESGLRPALLLGPRRAIPVSLLAMDHAALVYDTLARQENAGRPGENDGRFALPVPLLEGARAGLTALEGGVLARLGAAPAALDRLLENRREAAAFRSLFERGMVRLSALTASDAAHVLGLHTAWDVDAARRAAELFARKRDGRGTPIAPDGRAIAERIIAAITRRSAEVVLSAALAEDGLGGVDAATSPLIAAALERRGAAARLDIGVALPVIGLGASAPTYYPAICGMLGAECVVPDHADVANAVGAVAGRVTLERSMTIIAAGTGGYRVQGLEGNSDFADLARARAAATEALTAQLHADASEAGASEIELSEDYSEKAPSVEGQKMFLEGTVTLRASGRPRATTRRGG